MMPLSNKTTTGIAMSVVLLLAGTVGYFSAVDQSDRDSNLGGDVGENSIPAERVRVLPLAGRNRAEAAGAREPLKPHEAEILLHEARQDQPDIDKRSALAADLIKRLCAGGYTEEAWNLIEANPGQVRDFQITAFFEHAQITTEEALAKMQQCQFNSDIQIAFSFYLSRFSPADFDSFLKNPEYQEVFKELKERSYPKLISNSLSMALQNKIIDAPHLDQLDLLAQAERYRADGLLGDSGLALVLKLAKQTSSAERWHVIVALDSNNREIKDLRDQIIADMIRRDAVAAVNLVSSTKGPQALHNFQTVIVEWVRVDSGAANAWFAANRHQMDESQHDGAVMGFFQTAINYGDVDTAGLWAQEVKNPTLRGEANDLLKRNK